MTVTFVSNNMTTSVSYSSSQSNTTQADSVIPQDLNASKYSLKMFLLNIITALFID